MKLVIKVPYKSMRVYRTFCYLLLHCIKLDLLRRLNKKKLEIRKQFLDKAFEINADYYQIYRLVINSLYLSKDPESRFYCIQLDTSIKVQNVLVYQIFKVIEYGVIGLQPYPFMRKNFSRYKEILSDVYSIYCKEGRIDLSLRRSDNRRPKISARR